MPQGVVYMKNEPIKDIEVTLPTPEKCKKYTDTNITDLARMTNITYISKMIKKSQSYYPSQKFPIGPVLSNEIVDNKVTTSGSLMKCNNIQGIIIPKLILSPIVFDKIIKNAEKEGKLFQDDNGKDTIQFGEYSQYLTNGYTSKALTDFLKINLLEELNEYYSFPSLTKLVTTHPYTSIIETHPVYQYKSNKYTFSKIQLNKLDYTRKPMMYGGYTNESNNYYIAWLKVSPILWEVDYEHNTLICKCRLLSGIPYDRFKPLCPSKDFSDTTMYKFLNTTFLRDITQNMDFIRINGSDVAFNYEEDNQAEIINSDNIAISEKGICRTKNIKELGTSKNQKN